MNINIINRINEHKELTARINKLASFIQSIQLDMTKGDCKVDVEDYTLMRVQLEHMINYHDVLESRLNKHGIVVDGDKYYEDVTEFKEPIPTTPKTPAGSDFDADKKENHDKPKD